MNLTEFKTGTKEFALKGWTSYVSVALLLVLLLAILGTTTGYIIEMRADQLTKTHVLDEDKTVACTFAGSDAKAAFINAQRAEISRFGNSHRWSAVKFFSYFYTTYIVFTVFGLIAAISLAVITKNGIAKASPHLITVFLVCTSIVVLYQGSFGVFQHRNNIDSNSKLAVKYAVLADQIDTYCVTGKINVSDPSEALADALPKAAAKPANSTANIERNPAPSQAETPTVGKIRAFYVEPTGDEFINFVAWQMENLRNLTIAIDDSKVTEIDGKRFTLQ